MAIWTNDATDDLILTLENASSVRPQLIDWSRTGFTPGLCKKIMIRLYWLASDKKFNMHSQVGWNRVQRDTFNQC